MTIEELIAQAESGLTAQFARIDRMEEIGTRRVLDAFREHQVAYRHFAPTTGYGYDDVGRDTLEKIFAELFGTQRTCYSTEGSSQCIRAMLYLALNNRPKGNSNVIVAARNVHKTFVYAAALLDIEPVWLWPESSSSLCGCPVTPAILKETLNKLDAPPAAVYVTSPDYLGEMADMGNLAKVCHDSGTILLVDNAHGAYLKFLSKSLDPLDLGADMCCDSAHKTLPVLTGGAYLHISASAPPLFAENAARAMALFACTLCRSGKVGIGPLRLHQPVIPYNGLAGRLQQPSGGRLPKEDSGMGREYGLP